MSHTGHKYHKTIRDVRDSTGQTTCVVDVYQVGRAFRVTDPAAFHALKKILMPGQRGKGSEVEDYIEATDATLEAAREALRNTDHMAVDPRKLQRLRTLENASAMVDLLDQILNAKESERNMVEMGIQEMLRKIIPPMPF